MNTLLKLSSAAILSFSVLASAQDTVTSVPAGQKWFADTNSEVAAASLVKKDTVRRADTIMLADSGRPYTIVVTATRRAQSSEWVADDHREIDVKKQSSRSSKSVAEMLASSVPAWFADNGGGAVKTVSLRGAGSERTLVLVDGQRIGTTDGDLGDLSPEIIERIEIVEAGQSALYGMDAVGGVVNIITKRAASEHLSGNVSTSFSSYEPSNGRLNLNTLSHNFSAGKKFDRFEWLAGSHWRSSDGRYEFNDPGKGLEPLWNNGFTDWGFFQRLAYDNNNTAFDITASYSDRNAESPGDVVFPDSSTTIKKTGFVTVDGTWAAKEYLTLKLNSSFTYDSIHYKDQYQISDQSRLSENLELIQEFTFGRQMANTGVQVVRQSIRSTDVGNHAVEKEGVFANGILEQTVAEFIIRETPAIRFDYSTVFKGIVNGKAGLIATWRGLLKPSVFVNVGSSSRSPTFNDLYWPLDAYKDIGNPHLKPERGGNIDAGVQAQHHFGKIGVSGRVTYFSMLLSDMIIWQKDTSGITSPENIDKASIRGFKFSARLNYANTGDVTIDFADNNARNTNTDKVLVYRPKYIGIFSGQASVARLTVGISCRYSSKVFVDKENSRHLPSNWTFDANLGCKILSMGACGDGMRLVYDVLNIADKKQSTNEGYPLPGREHRLSLKMSF